MHEHFMNPLHVNSIQMLTAEACFSVRKSMSKYWFFLRTGEQTSVHEHFTNPLQVNSMQTLTAGGLLQYEKLNGQMLVLI